MIEFVATDVTEDVTEQVAVDSETQVEESATSRWKIIIGGKKVKILALLAVVMAGEAVGVYFVLPKPTGSNVKDGEDVSHNSQSGENSTGSNVDTIEVPIGSFTMTNSLAGAGVIHVTFKVVAIVSTNVERDFREAVTKTYEGRVKQSIVKVVRSSSLDDLGDPELSVIKRKIKEEVNKTLLKSYIIHVVVSEFKTVEQ